METLHPPPGYTIENHLDAWWWEFHTGEGSTFGADFMSEEGAIDDAWEHCGEEP